jgi:hypothetical protein
MDAHEGKGFVMSSKSIDAGRINGSLEGPVGFLRGACAARSGIMVQ